MLEDDNLYGKIERNKMYEKCFQFNQSGREVLTDIVKFKLILNYPLN